MSKNTKTTTTKTADEFVAALDAIRTQRKELRAKFKADVQKCYDDYRAAVKKLRADKAALWKKHDAERDAKKAEREAAKAKAKADTKMKVVEVKPLRKAAAAKEVKGVAAVKAARKTTKKVAKKAAKKA